tara:strand:- start:3506 stop:5845 length:2340 start_codon:yes stop_codon:yes gene_type:complete
MIFHSRDIPKYGLIILYIITGSLTNFGAIDILAPQWIYLGTINLITCIYLLFFSKNHFHDSFTRLFSTLYIYVYIFYILWNAGSYFYAVNSVETAINFPRTANTFFAIFFSTILLSKIPKSFFFVTTVFVLFLTAEMVSYYYDFSKIYPVEGLRVIRIKGFAGNKNITAASIAFKIPFAIYFLLTSKRIIFKILMYIVLLSGILAITLIEARAAILSSTIVFILVIVSLIFIYFNRGDRLKKLSYKLVTVVSVYLFAFLINIIATSNANNKFKKVAITDTFGKISFTEKSSNGRFGYWLDAWSYIKENPIFSSGLGNWKIESIEKGKDHISGYTVPYHAHNDFIHVFAETGILGGFAYLFLFTLIIFYIFKIIYLKPSEDQKITLKNAVLLLPLIVYGIDALLNFPVARPLMQSSLAIYLGLILSTYIKNISLQVNPNTARITSIIALTISLLVIIPGLVIHIISFKSLRQQGRLLYEFNNAQYTYKREELDKISHDFPNLTETAMPIKAMKARYYYLSGNKEEAHKMASLGSKDNPKIHFGDNLKAQFFLQENKIDSAYFYAKRAFNGLPNNMPHYDIYMRTLAYRREATEINNTFERVKKSSKNKKSVWTIYLRTLALTRSLGDPFSMAKAQEAFNMYPNDDNIFQLYRILTYGQERITKADNLSKEAKTFFDNGEFSKAAKLYLEAFDEDPLQYTHSLNAALSLYNIKDLENALKYFSISNSSKNPAVIEKALRFKGLALISRGDKQNGCAIFIQLFTKFPKRMYRQEFNKYCGAK